MGTFDPTKSLTNAVRDFRQKLVDFGMTEEGADHYVAQHRDRFVVNGDGVVRIDGISESVDDPIAHLARRTFVNAGAGMKAPPREPTAAEIAAVRSRMGYYF
jgi:hypothetical protein